MLTELKQFASKVESVEGTAETLTAADAKVLAEDQKIEFDPEVLSRNLAIGAFSKVSKLIGKRSGKAECKIRLAGSGTPTTNPEWIRLIESCGFVCNSLSSLSIGAITGGPFQHGETITGGTSGATGRVVIATADGASLIFFVSLSGTFSNGETITGGTSGATATTSSDPSDAGKILELMSTNDSISTLTTATYDHEIRKILKGCRGNVKFNFKSGNPVIVDFSYLGVYDGVTDQDLLSGIDFGTPPKAPNFVSAALTCDDVALTLDSLEIDLGIKLAPRPDQNSDKGILSYKIVGREPVGSFDPEMLKVATHDFYGKWMSGAEMVLDFIVGSASGNKFRFYIPKLQYTKIESGDREGIATAQSTFCLNGDTNLLKDREICILFL